MSHKIWCVEVKLKFITEIVSSMIVILLQENGTNNGKI